MSFIDKHYKAEKPLSLSNFQLPEIQRSENQSHSDEIYQFEKSYYDIHKGYCLQGNISVAIDILTQIQYLIDGNHRVNAYKRLLDEFPDRAITITIDYYECEGTTAIEQTYKLVNTNLINPITQMSIDEYKVINETIKWMQTTFRDYVKTSQSPHKPCFNLETIKDALIEKRVVKALDITTGQALIDLIIGLNTFYCRTPPATFRKWGIKDITKYIGKINDLPNRCYLGLYKTEWIDILVDCPPDKYDQIEHLLEGHRTPISKLLRKEVWNSRLMDGECYCCTQPITFDNFECGHIVAVSKGGRTTLDNLKPICRPCNMDMRNTNLEEYRTSLKNSH
jgi:hypothetical protein